ncbi:MAG: hypothetical protein MOIL_00303 [Candidatus Methanolliviera sp. GoM_oil]|nr:MAG: hypothetical protein MOIL_00303 [Candidatus Methanolliviera sp. GoM_oil]
MWRQKTLRVIKEVFQEILKEVENGERRGR